MWFQQIVTISNMNIEQMKKDLLELQDKALLMIEIKEFTSAHKLHKQIMRLKKLIKESEC